jgi:hypothetical protein
MASTVFATVTTPGPAGPTGPPGYSPQFIVQAGAPTVGLGQNGDMFIDSSTGNVWGPKANNAWPSVPACNIKGPTGATGAAGYSPQYIVAAGAPAPATGQNGDMYIDSSTSNVFGPKTGGAWGGVVCNIKGATGATGPQGPPGVGYNPKGAWSSATTYVQGDEVTSVNLLYISLQGGNLNNVPASSPTWWQLVGSGTSQTPWTSDIDGGTHTLFNVGKIAVGNPGTVLPDADTANVHVMVGPSVAGSAYGEMHLIANASSGAVGSFNFANLANTGTEKRIGAIAVYTDGAINSGSMAFYTWNTGAVAEAARISSQSNVGIGLAPTNTARVDVLAQGAIGIRLKAVTGNNVQLRFAGSGATGDIWAVGSDILAGNGGKDFTIDDLAAGPRFVILPSGNCGIGLTAPAQRLDVGGTIGFTTYLYGDSKLALQTNDAFLRINASGSFTSGIWVGASPFYMNSGALHLGSQGGTGSINISATAADAGNRVQIDGNANGITFFNTKGNFGINTPSPTGVLTVIPASNPNSVATATQIQIGEASDNGAYRLSLGFGVLSSTWCGIIQNTAGGAAGYLMINPSGGLVGIGGGTTLPIFNLQVIGNLGVTQSANLHITLGIAPGGVATATGITAGGLYYDTGNNCLRLETLSANVAWRPLVINYSGGNVGIGANLAPVYTLDVTGSCRATSGFATSSKYNVFGGPVGSATAPAPTDANLVLYNNSGGNWAGIGSDSAGNMWFRTGTSGTPNPALMIYANPQNRVGVNQLTPSYALDVTGDINATGNFRLNGAVFQGGGLAGVQTNGGGNTTGTFTWINFCSSSPIIVQNLGVSGPNNNTISISYGYSSDLRLKQNVVPLEGGLSVIMQLKPVRGEWNGLASTNEGEPIVSVIAQDLQAVIPDAIHPFPARLQPEDTELTDILGFDPMAIVAHLILAVQQLNQQLNPPA